LPKAIVLLAMVCMQRRELVGAVLDDRYCVRAPIGVGGSGAVFEAERLVDGKLFAIKVLQRDAAEHPDLVRRLRREAEVGRALHHPGIARCIDQGELHDGSPYLVMERLHGESLLHLLSRVSQLSLAQACLIGSRVASILHTVHARGYVHRDVKSEHVWLARLPSGGLSVHLLDFGVCLSPFGAGEHLLRERGRVFGTPGYISPEQARGDDSIDGRSDLFALGVVMFEALSGERPFRGENAAILLRRVLEQRAPDLRSVRPDITPETAAAIARLLAPDAAQRPSNARAAERSLRALAASTPPLEHALAAMLRPSHDSSPPASMNDMPTRNLAAAGGVRAW